MKLPVDFGTKLFFRILLPGLVLAALLSRLSYGVVAALGFAAHWPIIFVVEAAFFGFVFVALDMPIYMLFEGRRFWPGWLRRSLLDLERARLYRLHKAIRAPQVSAAFSVADRLKMQEAERQRLEALVEFARFPLRLGTFQPQVVWPTRLGNLIAAFEQYPRIKYGLDAIFFWPRLWVVLDQPTREEVDNQQALADGLLYTVLALVVGALGALASAPLDYFRPGFLPMPVIWPVDVGIAAVLLAMAYLAYRLSLFTHAQFGELFKAVFDQHQAKLISPDLVAHVGAIAGDAALGKRAAFERNMAVWRFLRWHRVRPRGQTRNRRARTP